MFDVNKSFWQFLNKMADQFLLSLLWIACSIPIVTFGASTTAFFSVSMQLHKDMEGNLPKSFWREFRRNFKRSTWAWLAQLVAFSLVVMDLWLCYKMNSALGWFLFAVIAVLALLFLAVCLFLWPLISCSGAPLRRLWCSAAYITVTYLLHSVSMLLLIGLGMIIAGYFSYLAAVVPAVVCYQYARIYVWIFEKNPYLQSVLQSSGNV